MDFKPDHSNLEWYLNSLDGPVADFIGEMADKTATLARGLAPVREGNLWNNSATPSSNARPPGFLKASIHGKRGKSRSGKLYGSANAAADPAIFLEYPAVQLHEKRPFLTTALWSVTII